MQAIAAISSMITFAKATRTQSGTTIAARWRNGVKISRWNVRIHATSADSESRVGVLSLLHTTCFEKNMAATVENRRPGPGQVWVYADISFRTVNNFRSNQVWGHTSEKRVAASTIATVLPRTPSGHHPGKRQARHAHNLQTGLHLTQPRNLRAAPRLGPAPRDPTG